MEFFTDQDLVNMVIQEITYNEETKGWTFLVSHGDNSYNLKDFNLPHPDDVTDGNVVAKVKELMLRTLNLSTREIIKQKIKVEKETILYKPITELTSEEYIKPDESKILEFDGPGYDNFFLDELPIYKYNINILLDTSTFLWNPGRYMKSMEWIQVSRIVNVRGNKIKLHPIDRASENKEGTWEYWDGSSSNIIEYNGIITQDMTLDFSEGSKYNVHLILDTVTMTWNYGPDNVDLAWIGQGKQISIDGIKVDLKIGRTENGFAWYYL